MLEDAQALPAASPTGPRARHSRTGAPRSGALVLDSLRSLAAGSYRPTTRCVHGAGRAGPGLGWCRRIIPSSKPVATHGTEAPGLFVG